MCPELLAFLEGSSSSWEVSVPEGVSGQRLVWSISGDRVQNHTSPGNAGVQLWELQWDLYSEGQLPMQWGLSMTCSSMSQPTPWLQRKVVLEEDRT